MEEENNSSLFPIDIQLQDVRQAIKDRTDFREIQTEDFIVFIYFLGMNKDIFPDPNTAPDERTKLFWKLRRECRGLVFSKVTEQVISRRFHKFFNVNEIEETKLSNINLNSKFIILEKMDGSMISPFYSNSKLRFGTKSGITDTALDCETFISQNRDSIFYEKFSAFWITKGYTPIFEWCNHSNPIVLTYEKDSLHLIALRNIRDGTYLDFEIMKESAASMNIPTIKKWTNEELEMEPSLNFHQFYTTIQKKQGVEGFVIRFETGQMLKIKTHWYFEKNHALDKLKNPNERHRWETILGDTYDDIRGFLRPDEKEVTDAFATDLIQQIDLTSQKLLDSITEAKKKFNRKEFSAHLSSLQLNPVEQGLRYAIFDKLDLSQPPDSKVNFDNVKQLVIKTIQSNLNNPKRFEQVRVSLAGNLTFKNYKTIPSRLSENDE